MHVRYLLLVVCLVVVFNPWGHANAVSANYPEVMIILDGSGSMWEKAGEATKIEVAKNVLNQLVPTIPDEVRLGLTVYGHRQKGNCQDIEVLIPPGSNDRKGLLQMTNSINPKGKTPIADSVTKVVELLKNRENETTIMLVSDGEETCSKNPCQVVKALKKTGIKFILHVVGFDVNSVQRAQLNCLAKAGGGQYFGAKNAASLLDAFQVVKTEVVKKVAIEKAKTVQKKAKTGLGKLHLVLPGGDQSLGSVTIIRKKDQKAIKTISSPVLDSTHPLLAGEYTLTLGFANTNYQKPSEVTGIDFVVNGGEITELKMGALVFNVADSLKAMPASSVTIRSVDGKIVVWTPAGGNSYYFFKTKPLPAGRYSFEYHYETMPMAAVIANDIMIKSGEETLLTLDSGISLKENSQGVTGWDLVPQGSSTPILSVRKRFDNSYPLWAKFPVQPGIYSLQVFIQGMDEPLPVAEGISIEKRQLLEFDTGL